MLSYYFLPIVIGSIYWLVHKSQNKLGARNKYKRQKLFGFILMIMLGISLALVPFIIYLKLYSPEKFASKALWYAISVAVGWRWLKTTWMSFEAIEEEKEKRAEPVAATPRANKKRKKMPYEYGAPSGNKVREFIPDESEIKESSRRKVAEALKAVQQGADKEQMLDVLLAPDDFYECIGALAITAEAIFPLILDTVSGREEINPELKAEAWKGFERDQKYCDDFFFGGEMRTYVIATAWKNDNKSLTWEMADKFLSGGGLDIDKYREDGWWRVACFYHIANLGFTKKEAFKAQWIGMSGEQRLAVVEALSQQEIDHYRLMD